MIRFASIALVLLAAPIALAQEANLGSVEQKASYIIGRNIASEYVNPDVPFDIDALIAGFRDGATDKPSKIEQEEMAAVMEQFQTLVTQHMKKRAEERVKEGKEFLEKNAKRPEVKTTKSGLQYEIVKAGTGATPKISDTVVCHYKGTFIDGEVFDSSYQRGEPAQFPVDRVITGWTEALQLMKVGAKWKLFIPSDLAYGESGNRGIPPNTVLLFEIELLDIAAAPQEPGN